MSEQPPPKRAKTEHKKLPQLPPNAKVTKRPLLHPAISSPYSGPTNQKVIYVSAKTPFVSAVKRVEKLLHLSDKRLVQSATTLAKQESRKLRRNNAEDEIGDIARIVEEKKARRRKGEKNADDESGEQVVLKGTGKAIQRVMELGLWFQQREEYEIRLRTGSAAAIDDIEVDEDAPTAVLGAKESKKQKKRKKAQSDHEDVVGGAEGQRPNERHEDAAVQTAERSNPAGAEVKHNSETHAVSLELAEIPDTRIRYTSVLEVAVRLR